MNDIDFLPADYVCVQATRTNNNWLRGLFATVLVLMAIGWAAQHKSMIDLTARRNRMQEHANSVLSKLDSGDHLKAELNHAENGTRLLDGLRSQVPPTRWLSAIVGALPSQTSMIEIHAEIDDGTEVITRPDPNAAANKPNPTTPTDLVQQDLDRLSKLTPRRSLTISLRGSAADDLEVSKLLTALHKTELFEKVQLLFTDQLALGDKTIRSFAIRLRTRPLNSRPLQRANSQPVAAGNRPIEPK